MRTSHKKLDRQTGIALLTTLLLLILMSSLMVGFILLVMSGQRLSGMNNESSKAFYGAEAGMEKLTADLGTLFNANYAPSAAVVTAISTAPPALGAQGIAFVDQSGNPAYNINFTQVNGFPVSSFGQVTSGSSPYQGMTALATPYNLVVTARTATGAEAKLTRQIQTIGIPLFQFGIFSDTDLSYFPGPDFKFGGRVHTNGDLYLASGGPAGAGPASVGSNQLWQAATLRWWAMCTAIGLRTSILSMPGPSTRVRWKSPTAADSRRWISARAARTCSQPRRTARGRASSTVTTDTCAPE
jgi:hypothetical protein